MRIIIIGLTNADTLRYSTNMGSTGMSFNALPRTLFLITAHGRKSFDFGIKLLAVPDSTSQKFILLGQIAQTVTWATSSKTQLSMMSLAWIQTTSWFVLPLVLFWRGFLTFDRYYMSSNYNYVRRGSEYVPVDPEPHRCRSVYRKSRPDVYGFFQLCLRNAHKVRVITCLSF
jgi:hypothetical protein